jgi:hypothetical protein
MDSTDEPDLAPSLQMEQALNDLPSVDCLDSKNYSPTMSGSGIHILKAGVD